MKHRITVFIPTYNRLPLLRRAVSSVFSCGTPVHLHVLDNNSIDGTYDWLKELRETGQSSLQITRHPDNIGAEKNYLAGFRSVKTEFLIPLADDDELIPGFLEQALKITDEYAEVGAVVGARATADGKRWKPQWDNRRSLGFVTPEDHIKEFLTFGHYVTWSAILWKTELMHKYNLPESAMQYGLPSDVYFQFKYFLNTPAFLTKIPAATFDNRADQASSNIGLNDDSLIELSNLANQMNEELISTFSHIETVDAKDLTSIMVSRWALFIKSNRKKAIASGGNLELERSMMAYINGLVPYIGFREFPFLSELTALSDEVAVHRRTSLRLFRDKFVRFLAYTFRHFR